MTRKPYDSPVRREQMARTRARILDAACALVHEFETWDWRALTFAAVATRAGVGERTVYRYFSTEQALHDAVMVRLSEESGVSYDGLNVDDVSKVGAKVYATMSEFAAPPWAEPDDATLVAEDERRKRALIAAVDSATTGWSDADKTRAAAALDVLWGVPSYRRLVTGWGFDANEATDVMDWAIGIVVAAIRNGERPAGTRRPAKRRNKEQR
jgi:AcrR family transcriptional regulator